MKTLAKLLPALGLVLTLGALSAGAQTLTPEEELIRAMTLCPEPHNPIANGVRALGGDLLVNVRILQPANPTVIVADVVASPRTLDRSADTPDTFKGRIRVEMGYRQTESGRQTFYCRLQVFPASP